ncbi:hypothetical protein [Arenivirga flava]|uniref:Uncharacterized protein n=1 Tax=Arenivirga flava TaxID=1930060 RepID=A0AA37UF55_9MICO|nr:hypothetical protein [Arenivirga flava]GMA28013.1 hypothetical protein GCM10025874_12660 [Arenivirga flava]
MLAVPLSALVAHAVGISVLRGDDSLRSTADPLPVALTLLPSTLIAQLIVNAAPIAVFALAQAGVASQFQYSFSLARIPLFMVVPLQSMLISPFAQMIEQADRAEFVRRVRLGATILLALAITGCLLGAILGPPIIEFVFGAGRSLEGFGVGLLVGAVIVHVALIIGTQLLLAARRPQDVAISWTVALAAAAVVLVALAVPAGITLASGSAVLVGSAAGAIVALRRSLNALRSKDAS